MLRYVYSRDTIVISTASDMYNNVYRGTSYNKLKNYKTPKFPKLILSEWKKIKLKLSHMFSSKGKKKHTHTPLNMPLKT